MSSAFASHQWPSHGRALIAVGALAALLLSGCGAAASSSSSSRTALRGAAPAQGSSVPGFAGEVKAGAGTPTVLTDAAKPAVGVGPKLTKSASLDLQVKDIAAGAAKVRSVAAGLQALVLSEQIGKGGPGGPGPVPLAGSSEPFGGLGTLTLSVPADQLEVALNRLSAIGTVLARTTTSQDVTAQYVDTTSRLKTMRASVERVRALMAQTTNIGQVVVLEGELSRREADMESLQSQLDALGTSVERSTLAVSLSTPGNEPASETGFGAGLRAGWDAFMASAKGLFTALGALLPFAVFFTLVGAPLLWWRRRRANTPPAATVPGGPEAR